jgi:hypothetical protein
MVNQKTCRPFEGGSPESCTTGDTADGIDAIRGLATWLFKTAQVVPDACAVGNCPSQARRAIRGARMSATPYIASAAQSVAGVEYLKSSATSFRPPAASIG